MEQKKVEEVTESRGEAGEKEVCSVKLLKPSWVEKVVKRNGEGKRNGRKGGEGGGGSNRIRMKWSREW